jgi:hypothetical protein
LPHGLCENQLIRTDFFQHPLANALTDKSGQAAG